MFVKPWAAALALGLGLASVGVGTASAADPVRLAVAVPIVVPAGDQELLDARTLAEYTAAQGILTRQLDAVSGRTVALGIDPRIIASIRLLGTTAPASAVAWLDRLRALPNETFPLAWADADLTLQTQAGAGVPLQPETFDFAVDPARFGGATPAPTGSPTTPAAPTDADVVAWPYTVDGLAWPRDDSVIASDLPAFAAGGYDTTILTSTNAVRDSTATAASAGTGTGIVVSDSALSAALRTAVVAPQSTDWSAAVAQLSASLTASAGTTALVTLDRTVPGAAYRLGETLDALAADPAVQLVPLSTVLGATSGTATVVDEPQDAARLSRVGQMLAGETAERAFATVATDPAAITSQRRLELLTLLSVEWADDLDGWATAADDFTTASIALRNAVHLVTGSNFLLVADNDQYLPITVDNALGQAVTVYITVRSQSSLLVIDQPRAELTVEGGSQGKVNVPVHSLSNGVVEVDVSLASATGVAIGAPVASKVNVQAGWETPIVVAIAAIVVIVFGVGIVRTILRRRKERSRD